MTREFPAWVHAVQAAVAAADTPLDRITAYVSANVQQAAGSTHGWRSSLARTSLSETAGKRIHDLHTQLSDIARSALADLDPCQVELQLAIIQALVDACVRRIDAGDDPDVVLTHALGATRRLLA